MMFSYRKYFPLKQIDPKIKFSFFLGMSNIILIFEKWDFFFFFKEIEKEENKVRRWWRWT